MPGKLKVRHRIILIVLPIAAAVIALCIGRMQINPLEIFKGVANMFGADLEVNALQQKALWSIRLPRILLAMAAGAGLSAAGCVFQSLFSNPLATPDTLGVASGSCFGAALAILLGAGLAGTQISAFFFGIAAVALTYLSGVKRVKGINSIVLAGIMIGSLFNALVSLVKFVADTESQLPAITYWLMGSLSGKSYENLVIGCPVILVGIIVLWLLRWRLNVLPLSENEARATGVDIKKLRVVCIICATAVTASTVSMCGQVGWVGLLIPHICRMRFGNNHLSLFPASVSLGAVFMVLVDTLARSLTASEIPISILTAIIGAPFFIMLMRKSRGWEM